LIQLEVGKAQVCFGWIRIRIPIAQSDPRTKCKADPCGFRPGFAHGSRSNRNRKSDLYSKCGVEEKENKGESKRKMKKAK
jgi:hypothetical protein